MIYALRRGPLRLQSARDDLSFDSPTTRPICRPPPRVRSRRVLASLEAAFDQRRDYLYFVAQRRSHVFPRTLDEHNANVRQYQCCLSENRAAERPRVEARQPCRRSKVFSEHPLATLAAMIPAPSPTHPHPTSRKPAALAPSVAAARINWPRSPNGASRRPAFCEETSREKSAHHFHGRMTLKSAKGSGSHVTPSAPRTPARRRDRARSAR